MESRLPAILFISGIALLILALITGEAKGGIIVIFPFIIGRGLLSLFGMLFIFLSFILFFFSFPKEMEYEMVQSVQEKKKGIIFIGPIPIIFSGDIKIAWLLILLIAIFLIFIIFLLFLSLYYSKMVIWISF